MSRYGKILSLLAAIATMAGVGECAQEFVADGWELVGPGGGGRYVNPAISPHDADLLFCSNDMRSSYRSTDGGATWILIPHTEGITSVAGWVFHPTDTNAVYAVVGTDVLVSADRGISWSSAGTGFPTKFTFDWSRPGTGMGDLDGQLLATTDSGQTWLPATSQLPVGAGNVIDVVYGDTAGEVLVGTVNGVYRSANDGSSWTDLSAGLPYQGAEPTLVDFDGGVGGGQTVLFATVSTYYDGGWQGGVCRSVDDGASWQEVHSGLGSFSSGTPHQKLAVCRDDPDTVYMVFDGSGDPTVYRTTNGGGSWQKVFVQEYGAPGYNVANRVWTDTEWGAEFALQGLCISDTDGDQAMIATITGAFHSSNGGTTWQAVHAPAMVAANQPSGNMPVMAILGYYFDPHDTNRHYMAGNDFCGWRSLDAGASWQLSDSGNPWPHNVYSMALDPDVPGRIWAAAAVLHDLPLWKSLAVYGNGGVIVSDDYGETWANANGGGLPSRVTTDIFIEPGSPVGSRHLWAASFGDGPYYSPDGGAAWQQRKEGIGPSSNVFRVRRDAHGRLFAMATMQKANAGFYPGALYIRSEDDTYWQSLFNGAWIAYSEYVYAGGPPVHPTEFDVHPANPDIIYVSGLPPVWLTPGGGIWKTKDGGTTWKQCFSKSCMSVKVDPQNPNIVFASTLWDGLYVSGNGGRTWEPVENFPFVAPYAASFDPQQGDVVYMTTWGGMVWKGAFQTFATTPTNTVSLWLNDAIEAGDYVEDKVGANDIYKNTSGTLPSLSTDTPFSYAGNKSLDFNGIDESVYVDTLAGSTLHLTQSLTMEAWIKGGDNGTYEWPAYRVVLGHYSTYGLIAEEQSSGISPKFKFMYTQGSQYSEYFSDAASVTLDDGDWHHIAASFDADADEVVLYVDGIQDGADRAAQGTGPLTYNTGTPFCMGGETTFSANYKGLIDEARVSDVALDVSELGYLASVRGLPAATIMDVSPVGGNTMRMVVNVPGWMNDYSPETTTNLVDGAWADVPHSYTNDVSTMETTNLGYSAAEGTNKVIYLQTDEPAKFFRIISE